MTPPTAEQYKRPGVIIFSLMMLAACIYGIWYLIGMLEEATATNTAGNLLFLIIGLASALMAPVLQGTIRVLVAPLRTRLGNNNTPMFILVYLGIMLGGMRHRMADAIPTVIGLIVGMAAVALWYRHKKRKRGATPS